MLATIAGQIISLAVGPVARLRTRAFFYATHRHSPWHDSLCLRPDVHEELLFWQTRTPFLKGQPIGFGLELPVLPFLMQVVWIMGGMFWNWDRMLCMENGPSLKLARVRHGENSRLCIKLYVPMHDNSECMPLNGSQITRMSSM